MPKYKFSNISGPVTFPLSTAFVDKYMPEANATFVKVYLYGLRLCYLPGIDADNKKIADALDILETDVLKAFDFWESKGIVRRSSDGTVEFMDLSSDVEAQKPQKPAYKASDIESMMKKSDIKQLVSHAEGIFGKTLSQSEIGTLFGFYDWLHLPVEVILMLLEYCASLQKTSMRYAEKVALSWAEEGIDSIEKAHEFLSATENREKNTRYYKKLLGLRGGKFTDAEYAHIVQWTEKMGMPPELIKKAAEKASDVTGGVSFPYINGILQSWYKKDIKTVEDLSKDEIPKNTATSRQKQTQVSNRFVDFSQTHDYDFDAIEEKMQKKRMRK
ncbi:MAG: DnaD domain protein [Clostridia bacterium]|nr:DnaD domain protein [Clostridia bacterium]